MIHTDRLDRIAATGTGRLPRKIRLADDTVISVHAGPGAWCLPRPALPGTTGSAPADYAGPYTHVEVYFAAPLAAPPGWSGYEDFGIYSTVPVDLVRGLVAAHGGEHVAQDEWADVTAALGEGYLRDRQV